MQINRSTRSLGRVGLISPVILLILLAANSAFACPGHNNGVSYRVIKTRSNMPATVITYRSPAYHQRCANIATRSARYVAARRNVYNDDARYVAARRNVRYVAVDDGDDYYQPRSRRQVAVRNVTYAPRYVTVRRDPVYIDKRGIKYVPVREGSGVTYTAVRREMPVRYVAARDYDDYDYDRRYAAVRHTPAKRYVAVRDFDRDHAVSRVEYVAVRKADSGCARAVALRSCLDDVETTSARRVVVRTDDDLEDVIESDAVFGYDTDNVEYVPAANVTGTNRVQTAYYNGTNYVVNAAPHESRVAIRTYPETMSAYAPVSDDDDLEEQAILDDEGTTYVAADDIEDASLSTTAYRSSPVDDTDAVSYVPADEVMDNDRSWSGKRYAVVGNAPGHSIPYVALDEDRVFDDVDPDFIASNGLENNCSSQAAIRICEVDVGNQTVSFVPVEDLENLSTGTAAYVPVEDIEDTETVSYVPQETPVSYVPVEDTNMISDVPVEDADTVSYVPVENTDVSYVPVDDKNFSYVPVNNMNVSYLPVDNAETVMYVPADNFQMVSDIPVNGNMTYIAADDSSCVDAERVHFVDSSAVIVEEVDSDQLAAGLSGTQLIASQFGYKDGYEEGLEDALDGDDFDPVDSGDFRSAKEGYEDEFGPKEFYRSSYRKSFLSGYRAGFESARIAV